MIISHFMLCLCKIFLLEEAEDYKILAKNLYIDALRDILKPLAKNLITREVTLPVLVALIKESLVDAAEKDRQEIKKTDSRISLMTGVHRKDVRKIRELGYKNINDNTLNARVLAEWTGNRNYTDSNGLPKKLRPTGPNSFEQMVSSISTDIRPRTLLDEWITLKKVTLDDEGAISLDLKNYAPSESDDELLHFFGKNIGDHISSATNNIEQAVVRNAVVDNIVFDFGDMAANRDVSLSGFNLVCYDNSDFETNKQCDDRGQERPDAG